MGLPTLNTPRRGAVAITRGPHGGMASKRSKTGDPLCSMAMSAFQLILRGAAQAVSMSREQASKILGQCRAKAKAMRQASLARNAGREALAQHLEHRSKTSAAGLHSRTSRSAQARELAGVRQQRNAARAGRQATPPRPPRAVQSTHGQPRADRLAALTSRSAMHAYRLDLRESRKASDVRIREHRAGNLHATGRQEAERRQAKREEARRREFSARTRAAADEARTRRAANPGFSGSTVGRYLADRDTRRQRAAAIRRNRAEGHHGYAAAAVSQHYMTRGLVSVKQGGAARDRRLNLRGNATDRIRIMGKGAAGQSIPQVAPGRNVPTLERHARAAAGRLQSEARARRLATPAAPPATTTTTPHAPLQRRTTPAFASRQFGQVEHSHTIGSGVMNRAKAIFGPDVTAKDLSNLTGAPAGAHVRMKLHGEGLEFTAEHPSIDSMTRRIERTPDGKWAVYNAIFTRPEAAQGAHRSSAAEPGREVLARQIENAHRLGLHKIHTNAAGEFRNARWNGYYTWPRLGYDAPIAHETRMRLRADETLPEEVRAATHMRHVMMNREGRDWWMVNGHGQHLDFDLTPGSYSMRHLDAYLEAPPTSPADRASAGVRQSIIARRSNRLDAGTADRELGRLSARKSAPQLRRLAADVPGIAHRGRTRAQIEADLRTALRLPAAAARRRRAAARSPAP